MYHFVDTSTSCYYCNYFATENTVEKAEGMTLQSICNPSDEDLFPSLLVLSQRKGNLFIHARKRRNGIIYANPFLVGLKAGREGVKNSINSSGYEDSRNTLSGWFHPI